MMTFANVYKVQWHLTLFFILTIFISKQCTAFRVARFPDNGDIFERQLSHGTTSFRISSCSSDVEGEGNAYYKNESFCQCSHQQTFVVDDWSQKVAKCMDKYGDDGDDLDCDFNFYNLNYVKTLNPANDASQEIGTVQYRGSTAINFRLKSVSLWNVTWQSLPGMFTINSQNGILKWTDINPVNMVRKYSGVLFKLDLEAYSNGKRKKCLLLKISGARSYPLRNPVQRSSTSPTVFSSTSLSTSSITSLTRSAISSTKLITTASVVSSSISSRTSSSVSSSKSLTPTTATPSILTSTQSSAALPKTSSVHLSSFVPSTTFNRLQTSTVSKTLKTTITSTTSNISPGTPSKKTTSSTETSKYQNSISSTKVTILPRMTVHQTSSVMSSPHINTDGLKSSIKMQTSPQSPATSSLASPSLTSDVKNLNSIHPSRSSNVADTSKAVTHPDSLPSPTSKVTDGKTGKQKKADSQIATIAGTVVAAVVFMFATIGAFLLYRRKHLSKAGNRKRKETVTLGLTQNSFMNHSANARDSDAAMKKEFIGNPTYADKLPLRVVSASGYMTSGPQLDLYEQAYEKPVEPIYKEVMEEGHIYAETDGVYQPINEDAVASPDNYQPLDGSTLPRQPQTAFQDRAASPVYQVLEEDNSHSRNNAQSPIYHTVEQSMYQELSANDRSNSLYTGLEPLKPEQQEPVYHELETGAVRGHDNLNFEDGEEI